VLRTEAKGDARFVDFAFGLQGVTEFHVGGSYVA
jgi:hypothetical protein